MGLFDFLKSKDIGPNIQDLIWISQTAKQRGFLRLVDENPSATWVAWSTYTQTLFQDWYQAETGQSIHIELAAYLKPTTAPLYFLEHHPQFSKEQVLFEAIRPKEVVFLNALDDPLMQVFGSDRIRSVMERLGLKENELIEHKMITKSIQNAQKKLDQPGGMERLGAEFGEWVNGIRDY